MPNDKPTVVDEAPKPRGFQPGHARMGGRRSKDLPSKTKLAAELCAKHKFHPLEFMIECIKNGASPATPDKPSQPVSMSDRTRMSETLLSFLLPRLAATQITGANEGPLQVATLDMVELMRNPDLARAAQTLALGISNPDYVTPAKQIEGPEEDE